MIQVFSLDFLCIYGYIVQVYVYGTLPEILALFDQFQSLSIFLFPLYVLAKCQISFKENTNKSLLYIGYFTYLS